MTIEFKLAEDGPWIATAVQIAFEVSKAMGRPTFEPAGIITLPGMGPNPRTGAHLVRRGDAHSSEVVAAFHMTAEGAEVYLTFEDAADLKKVVAIIEKAADIEKVFAIIEKAAETKGA